MKIVGMEGMTGMDLQMELQRGGKFVMYQYVISVLVITFKRSSSVYLIRAGQGAVAKGLPFTLLSVLLGWWGIPWGIFYTIEAMIVNFGGGRDVTQQMLAAMRQPQPSPVAP